MSDERTRNHPIFAKKWQAKVMADKSAKAGKTYARGLGRGRAVCFRKVGTFGSYVARWTSPRNEYKFETLGAANELDEKEALDKAQKYFAAATRDWDNKARGIVIDAVRTVEDGVKQYVANLRAKKGDIPADRVESRLKPFIYDTTFGRIELPELTMLDVEQWVRGLTKDGKRKGRTANRIFRQFKAAMNYMKKVGSIQTDNAWKNVDPYNDPDGRRNAYLRPVQVKALLTACERQKDARDYAKDPELEACTPDLATLIRALLVTGARPGQLVKAKVSDFDRTTGTLRLISSKNKKGEARPYEFYLTNPAELKFFAALAKDKLPEAYLITRADGSGWVLENGEPARHQWAMGFRAAVKDANKHLEKDDRIPIGTERANTTSMYTVRHTAISEMLDSGAQGFAVADATGTSEGMIKAHYDQTRKERIKKELGKRKLL